ncbi:hypothetical protein [Chryseobacterium sp. 2987]|uniref:hypothetical protein n=1 Tax=Chryseobacterium sp. 2987 TaxID=2817767 RepID=UPI0028638676|nr:hypothetical protein [Chryseobacterium sp. 2987]MDR6919610.1 hypothetical protein [Chryseobacterium sp. 2987]
MDGSYFFIAFGTFGNPNGFRQSFVLGGNAAIAKEIRTFDLKTNAIKLFPDSRIYALRKDYAGGSSFISYCLYTFAKEQNSNRGGTFIGSGLLFSGKSASEGLVIEILNEFHENLEKNNVTEEVISVGHSDQFTVQKPKDFDKLGFHLQDIDEVDFTRFNETYLVVYCITDPAELKEKLTKAVQLLNMYDAIYFTQSSEIAEFVQQKGIFKIVNADGFENEIQLLQKEKERSVQNMIRELETEKESLKDEKQKVINEASQQIERNVQRHQDNEKKIQASRDSVRVISQEYDQYSKKLDELVNNLKSGGKTEIVRKQYQENKKALGSVVIQNKNIPSLDTVSSSGPTRPGTLKPNSFSGNSLAEFNAGRSREENPKSGSMIYKIMTFVLLFLLAGSYLSYFLFFNKGHKIEIPYTEASVSENSENVETVPTVQPDNTMVRAEENLNPLPNSELNDNDRILISKKVKSGTKIDSLVNAIYELNPSTIKDYYRHQKKDYKEKLYHINPASFSIKGPDTIWVDTLKKVPNYSKF